MSAAPPSKSRPASAYVTRSLVQTTTHLLGLMLIGVGYLNYTMIAPLMAPFFVAVVTVVALGVPLHRSLNWLASEWFDAPNPNPSPASGLTLWRSRITAAVASVRTQRDHVVDAVCLLPFPLVMTAAGLLYGLRLGAVWLCLVLPLVGLLVQVALAVTSADLGVLRSRLATTLTVAVLASGLLAGDVFASRAISESTQFYHKSAAFVSHVVTDPHWHGVLHEMGLTQELAREQLTHFGGQAADWLTDHGIDAEWLRSLDSELLGAIEEAEAEQKMHVMPAFGGGEAGEAAARADVDIDGSAVVARGESTVTTQQTVPNTHHDRNGDGVYDELVEAIEMGDAFSGNRQDGSADAAADDHAVAVRPESAPLSTETAVNDTADGEGTAGPTGLSDLDAAKAQELAEAMLSETGIEIEQAKSYLTDMAAVLLGSSARILGALGEIGSSVATFVSGLLVFVAAVFYMLPAERPLAVLLVDPLPFDSYFRMRIAEQLTASVAGLVFSTVVRSVCHGLSTLVFFTVLGLDFPVMAAYYSAFCAIFPLLSPWLLYGPVLLSLYLASSYTSLGVAVALLVVVEVLALSRINVELTSRIPNSNPYVIGLSIPLGMAKFGLQGVIIGPLLVIVLVMGYTMFSLVSASDGTDAAGSSSSSHRSSRHSSSSKSRSKRQHRSKAHTGKHYHHPLTPSGAQLPSSSLVGSADKRRAAEDLRRVGSPSTPPPDLAVLAQSTPSVHHADGQVTTGTHSDVDDSAPQFSDDEHPSDDDFPAPRPLSDDSDTVSVKGSKKGSIFGKGGLFGSLRHKKKKQ